MPAAHLLALATALPPYRFSQEEARRAADEALARDHPELERLLPLFGNAGIAQRWSARPLAWHLAAPSFAERNAAFLDAADELLLTASRRALARAGLTASDVDHVVAVCSTGIATPGLEARLAERLPLRPDVVRTPVFGLGCGGGVMGLGRAAALAGAEPGCRVLLLVVELCTLALRLGDRSPANLVACALFGDGAGAAVISTEGVGPALRATGEFRWPDTLDVMGWRIADDGLGVLFSVRVPEIVRERMGAATEAFLARHGLKTGDVERWISHPGGAKVVNALEQALRLPADALDDARAVLRDCGNMSAASVLFVLDRALAAPGWRRGLMTAMGPGFSASFALLER